MACSAQATKLTFKNKLYYYRQQNAIHHIWAVIKMFAESISLADVDKKKIPTNTHKHYQMNDIYEIVFMSIWMVYFVVWWWNYLHAPADIQPANAVIRLRLLLQWLADVNTFAVMNSVCVRLYAAPAGKNRSASWNRRKWFYLATKKKKRKRTKAMIPYNIFSICMMPESFGATQNNVYII